MPAAQSCSKAASAWAWPLRGSTVPTIRKTGWRLRSTRCHFGPRLPAFGADIGAEMEMTDLQRRRRSTSKLRQPVEELVGDRARDAEQPIAMGRDCSSQMRKWGKGGNQSGRISGKQVVDDEVGRARPVAQAAVQRRPPFDLVGARSRPSRTSPGLGIDQVVWKAEVGKADQPRRQRRGHSAESRCRRRRRARPGTRRAGFPAASIMMFLVTRWMPVPASRCTSSDTSIRSWRIPSPGGRFSAAQRSTVSQSAGLGRSGVAMATGVVGQPVDRQEL